MRQCNDNTFSPDAIRNDRTRYRGEPRFAIPLCGTLPMLLGGYKVVTPNNRRGRADTVDPVFIPLS